jgi:hypothetical protein
MWNRRCFRRVHEVRRQTGLQAGCVPTGIKLLFPLNSCPGFEVQGTGYMAVVFLDDRELSSWCLDQ